MANCCDIHPCHPEDLQTFRDSRHRRQGYQVPVPPLPPPLQCHLRHRPRLLPTPLRRPSPVAGGSIVAFPDLLASELLKAGVLGSGGPPVEGATDALSLGVFDFDVEA